VAVVEAEPRVSAAVSFSVADSFAAPAALGDEGSLTWASTPVGAEESLCSAAVPGPAVDSDWVTVLSGDFVPLVSAHAVPWPATATVRASTTASAPPYRAERLLVLRLPSRLNGLMGKFLLRGVARVSRTEIFADRSPLLDIQWTNPQTRITDGGNQTTVVEWTVDMLDDKSGGVTSFAEGVTLERWESSQSGMCRPFNRRPRRAIAHAGHAGDNHELGSP
jgi:hypothetical protein